MEEDTSYPNGTLDESVLISLTIRVYIHFINLILN